MLLELFCLSRDIQCTAPMLGRRDLCPLLNGMFSPNINGEQKANMVLC